MKKTFMVTTCLLGFLFGRSAFADDLCIALNNFSSSTVRFSAIVDPGYEYTVPPQKSATLSRDHMVGACFPDGCIISIYALDGTTPQGILIAHLPRGARIIYDGPDNYFADFNAKVKCVS